MDIAAQTVKSIGAAKPNGIEVNVTKKTSAAVSATTIMNVKESGKKKINLPKRNKSKF